jgi:hypothetical protein
MISRVLGNRNSRLGALLFFGVCGCGDLQPIGANACGNKVTEPSAAEDCDGEAGCGEPGSAAPCRYLCAVDDDCPAKIGCGVDGVCRQPTGTFALVDEVDSFTVLTTPGDVDGDGRSDLLRVSSDETVVHFYDAELTPAFTRIERNAGQVAPALGELTFDDAGVSDGRADVAVSVSFGAEFGAGVVVYRGQEDRTLSPVTHATFGLPNLDRGYGFSARARDPLHQSQAMAFLNAPGPTNNAVLVFLDPDAGPTTFLNQGLDQVPLAPEWLGGVAVAPIFTAADSPCDEIVFVHAKPASQPEWNQTVYVLQPCVVDPQGVAIIADTPVMVEIPLPQKVLDAAADTPLRNLPHAYSSVFIADADGDGDNDILVLLDDPAPKPERRPVWVIANEDQAGTFAAPLRRDDIVVGEPGPVAGMGATQIVLNVCPDDDPAEPYAPAGVGAALGFADLNGDGALDVASDDALWMSRKTVTGTVYDLAAQCLAWSHVAVAELGGNSAPDLAAARVGAAGIDVAISAGDGAVSWAVLGTDGPAFFLEAGDYDGDAIADVSFLEIDPARLEAEAELTAEANDSVWVAFGSASGGFDSARQVGAVPNARQLVSGRLVGGDGTDDVAVVTQDVTEELRLSLFSGSSSREIVSPFEVEGGSGMDIVPTRPTQMVHGRFGAGAVALAVVAERDVIPGASSSCTSPKSKGLWRLDVAGDGVLTSEFERALTCDDETFPGCDDCVLAAHDVDGDDVDELLLLASDVGYLWRAGAGSGPYFEALQTVTLSGLVFDLDILSRPASADLDGDGLDELIALAERKDGGGAVHEVVVFWNGGDGSLSLDGATRITLGHDPMETPAFALAELDGDVTLELLISARIGAEAQLRAFELVRGVSPAFDEGASIALEGKRRPVPSQISVGDYDGNGVDDLVVSDLGGYALLRGVPVR